MYALYNAIAPVAKLTTPELRKVSTRASASAPNTAPLPSPSNRNTTYWLIGETVPSGCCDYRANNGLGSTTRICPTLPSDTVPVTSFAEQAAGSPGTALESQVNVMP